MNSRSFKKRSQYCLLCKSRALGQQHKIGAVHFWFLSLWFRSWLSKACYRGGPKVRNCGRQPQPEAKTSVTPSGVIFKISPPGNDSATKRLPSLSKARPRGVVRPVAKVLFTPVGVNLRIVSLPRSQKKGAKHSVETKRLPVLSKAKPKGYTAGSKALGPAKTVRVPSGANL